ncbi:MAG TPA: hypothetical protein PKJ37_02375 [Acidobacteriota bacterium]|nr:hypothetical protein [Acidobacteriota bacterium]
MRKQKQDGLMRKSLPPIMDNLLLASILLFGELFSLHGKQFSSFLFDIEEKPYRPSANTFSLFSIQIITVVCFAMIRGSKLKYPLKFFLMSFLGLAASLATQFNDSRSILIFFLQLLLYATVAIIVMVEQYLVMNMDKEFWQFMFSSSLKTVGFVSALVAALSYFLRTISDKNNENAEGFITTLFYPLVIMAVCVAIFTYWIILPCWDRVVQYHRISDR